MTLRPSNMESPTRSQKRSESGFAHQRLDAYHVALALFTGVEDLASRFPRGHRDLRDQLRRAAAATVRHIAEGANRAHPADKAARFLVAKGEVGECDACLEMATILKLGCREVLANLRLNADRVAAMLTGLVRRERRRMESTHKRGSDYAR